MPKQSFAPMRAWVYDLFLWTFTIIVDLFFREVHPRGAYRIPKRGPIIFVAAPHANQFVDPLILMRAVKQEAGRRIAFLIAEKSMRRKFVGFMAGSVGSVPVSRALDMTKPATGRIYLPDPANNPLIVRGQGTKFHKEASIGGLIVLPTPPGGGSAANAEIVEIRDDEELVIKREFKGKALLQLAAQNEEEKGTKFKVAPKVDQTEVYESVFQRLSEGGCVGIFPEGGSHDRTELLPLKAGVAIMALGSLTANPNSGLKIIPCGMNYFHAHKFRSRAVIEFGSPVEVTPELIEQYNSGQKREAVKTLLDNIYNALVAVTVTSPDYDTLMVIQAARRLYRPTNKKLPLPKVVELNRRLIAGYTHYKDDPKIIKLRKSVTDYNTQLRLLGLRDHQVEYAKFSILHVVGALIYRVGKVTILGLAALPGILLFAPVFVATKVISNKKAAEALKASTVKVKANDVITSWKLMVAMALAPTLYTFYSFLAAYITYKNRAWGYVPEWIPWWSVVLLGYAIFPAITFAALRFGEVGMDIFKSLRPLTLSLNPSSANTLVKLRQRREQVALEVADSINSFGPELFPDFDNRRIIADPSGKSTASASSTSISVTGASPLISRRNSDIGNQDGDRIHPIFAPGSSSSSMTSSHIPRNESFAYLGNIGVFASRPASRARSRSNSGGGFPVNGFTGMDKEASLQEVSKRLQERRAERSRRRSQERLNDEDEDEEEGDGGVYMGGGKSEGGGDDYE